VPRYGAHAEVKARKLPLPGLLELLWGGWGLLTIRSLRSMRPHYANPVAACARYASFRDRWVGCSSKLCVLQRLRRC
jgi:hypothetical protein